MSKKTRRRLDAQLKAKVALEALRNEATIAELAAKYQLHPKPDLARKKQLLYGAAAVFAGGTGDKTGREAEINEFHAKIGQLTVERDFFVTEVGAMSRADARALFSLRDTAEVLATLDRLREANPEYTSPEGHLLYARSLEMEGRTAEVLSEYAALTAYYPGQEARCRYALLLQMTGRVAEARNLFEEIRKAMDCGPRHQYREQREWYELARRALAT